MTERVLFGLLSASAAACFGLLAIWAALGRTHWFPRLAALLSALGMFALVPATDLVLVFLAETLVCALPLFAGGVVRRISLLERERWRFPLADLFLATLTVAAACIIVRYLPTHTFRPTQNYAHLGIGFGLAALVGAWGGLSRRSKLLRLAVLIVVASLAGLTAAFDDRTYDQKPVGWPWCAVTAVVGCLVAAWLVLLRDACEVEFKAASSDATARPRTKFVGKRAASVLLSLLTAGILFLPALAFLQMLAPAPLPDDRFADPDAFEVLVECGRSLLGAPGVGEQYLTQVESYFAVPRPALAKARQALRRDWRVSVNYQVAGTDAAPILELRSLMRAFGGEGWLAQRKGRLDIASRRYLNVVELGRLRGGDTSYWLVGTAIEQFGLYRLRELPRDVRHSDKRQIIRALESCEVAREPVAISLERMRVHDFQSIGWPGQVAFLNHSVSERAKMSERHRAVLFRLLAADLAIEEYLDDHGRLPKRLQELVPRYLSRLPADPFDNGPLVFRRRDSGYDLYSIGPDGRDDGGHRVPLSGSLDSLPAGSDVFFERPPAAVTAVPTK